MNTKQDLRQKLIEQNRLWSFDVSQESSMPDDILIEKTLIYLDIDDINKLFTIYPFKKVKEVWRERLVIQGDYFKRLNRLLAWMYFDIKNPDKYIKTVTTLHLYKLSCPD
jgi:superfamily I DNA and/or RNA helicase